MQKNCKKSLIHQLFMPPAAKNLFEKRFLDFQKLFNKFFWERLISLFSFGNFVAKIRRWVQEIFLVYFLKILDYNINMTNLFRKNRGFIIRG